MIGSREPRLDAKAKVTGEMRYTSDIAMPGMLHAALLRSPFGKAKIGSVNRQAALRQPGVVAVVTAEQIPDRRFGPFLADQPPLARDRAVYCGEPVAAVVAESREAARQAVEDLVVEWEPEQAATSLELALAPSAPRVHERAEKAGLAPWLSAWGWADNNVFHAFTRDSGGVEEALLSAPHVFEDVFWVPAVHHYALEPFTAIARAEGGGLEIWSATQSPFGVRRDLASLFSFPLTHVRVVAGSLGGGFGAKLYTKIEPVTAACALAVPGRAVKLELAAEEWPVTVNRHAAWVWLRTGVDDEGRLLARDCVTVLDSGAYADAGPVVADKAGFRAAGPYRIAHIRSRACAVYTNLPPAGAYRGFGAPQVTWASESQLDMIAERLGIGAVELRRRNLLRRGELFIAGDTPIDCDLADGLEQVSARLGKASTPADGKRRGVGFAAGMKDGGGQTGASNAEVRVERDGTATVFSGSVEIGQGTLTVFTRLAAQELGISPAAVRVVLGDTARVPFDSGTYSSRTVALAGQAVVQACRSVVEQLVSAFRAEHKLAADVEVCVEDGRLSGGGRTSSMSEVVQRASPFEGDQVIGHGEYRSRSADTLLGAPTAFWEPAAAGVEVEVDPETGHLSVLRYVSLLDAGKALMPDLCEGQHVGAAAMAIGHALFECLQFDGGLLQNGSLADYRLPMFTDMPAVETILVEDGLGPGPYGSKGVAEGGMLPVAPAIANALANALGVRLRSLPMTSEAIWRALSTESIKEPSTKSGGADSYGR